MNKKGVELTMNTIVIAIIVLVVLAVMLIIFTSLTNKSGGSIFCIVQGLNADSDNDGVKNPADICPFDEQVPAACSGQTSKTAGCPASGQPCNVKTWTGPGLDPKCYPKKQ